jgi:hypothetical protein
MSDYDNSALSGAKHLNIATLETARLADQEAFLANSKAMALEEEADAAKEKARKLSHDASDQRKQIYDLTAEKYILEDLLEQRNAALGKVMDAVKDAVFEKMSWMLAAGKLGKDQGKTNAEVAKVMADAGVAIKTRRKEIVEEEIKEIEEKAEITDVIKLGIEKAQQGEQEKPTDVARENKRKARYISMLLIALCY